MEYRSLGRTGIQVSALCLGCMNFGVRADAQESARVIDAALDGGINFIDTADVYGHEMDNVMIGRGRSEEIVGQALKQHGRRERVILASKAHFAMGDDINMRGSSRRYLISACEASLKRLNTDWIDLYQLHHPTNTIPIDETLRALDDLIRAGKVRYIGTSSFGVWQIVESLWVSKEYGLNRFVCEQPAYNLLDRRAERELLPMARTYGLAVIPWSPAAGGFLTGKYRRGEPLPQDSRFSAFWRNSENWHFTERAFDVIDALHKFADEKGCSLYHLALAWCIRQPGITSPIIGPRTAAHVTDSLAALAVKFTDEDLTRIDQIVPAGGVTVPYYGSDGLAWTTWGPHEFRW